VTEEEWLAAVSPRQGLDYLCSDGLERRTGVSANRTKVGRRKLRLFLCACARRIWDLIPAGQPRQAVELGERLAEGERVASRIAKLRLQHDEGTLSARHAAHAASVCVEKNLRWATVVGAAAAAMAIGWSREEAQSSKQMQARDRGEAEEEREQADLLRDVFGNLFRPVTLDRRWLTPTVVALARGIYNDNAFDRLPILADALQDADCDNEDVLGHCRGPGPHVRGCWVVDLVLGKS
jgi:hypothetical protein